MSIENRRLLWQQPLQDKLSERKVYSEAELLEVFSFFLNSNSGSATGYVQRGLKIVIAAAITITQTIIIPRALAGLEITSVGGCPIFSSKTLENLFKVQANNVHIHDLYCISQPSKTIQNFVKVEYPSTIHYLKLIGNYVFGCRLFVSDADTNIGSGIIKDNYLEDAAASVGAPIVIFGNKNKVYCNILPDMGGDGITIADGYGNAIIGNSLSGSDITSSASNGENTIGLNSGVGAINKHTTDSCGLNTP